MWPCYCFRNTYESNYLHRWPSDCCGYRRGVCCFSNLSNAGRKQRATSDMESTADSSSRSLTGPDAGRRGSGRTRPSTKDNRRQAQEANHLPAKPQLARLAQARPEQTSQRPNIPHEQLVVCFSGIDRWLHLATEASRHTLTFYATQVARLSQRALRKSSLDSTSAYERRQIADARHDHSCSE